MYSSAVLCLAIALILAVAVKADTRTLTLVNKCKDTVYFQATSGSAPFKDGKNHCATNADCIDGSYCLADKGTPICFWNVPTPSRGDFSIPAGQDSKLVFPFVNNGNPLVWSGNIAVCRGDFDCREPVSQCVHSGCSPSGPSAVAEFTWPKEGLDYYDVSIINGVNVPMSFGPVGVEDSWYNSKDSYYCGTAGEGPKPGYETLTRTGTHVSSWKFETDGYYRYVTADNQNTCNSDSDCHGDTVCGLSYWVREQQQFKRTCGRHIGYWTDAAICESRPDYDAVSKSKCKEAIHNLNKEEKTFSKLNHYTYVMTDYYGCSGTGMNSCYQPSSDNTCCGCVNWNDVLGSGFVPSNTQPCLHVNSEWVDNVRPRLSWVKHACPNCYTYPYDDMSSTFTCSKPGTNNINYEVTFCPTD